MELYKLTIIIIDFILISLSILTIYNQQTKNNTTCSFRWFFDEPPKADWGTWLQDITLIINIILMVYLCVEVIDWNYKVQLF